MSDERKGPRCMVEGCNARATRILSVRADQVDTPTPAEGALEGEQDLGDLCSDCAAAVRAGRPFLLVQDPRFLDRLRLVPEVPA